MKMKEIQVKAKELGINSFGRSKVDLIREIQRSEGNFDCYGTAVGYCDQLSCCFRESCVEVGKPARSTNRNGGKTRKALG